MRSFNSGPAGTLMMLVGMILAISATWTAITRTGWAEAVPSIFIGLSLTAVGYSLFARSRRTRSQPDPTDDD
ncbi:hypothetical protein [Dactylosporangium sp. NPDC000521]|uniref:hypothetical protein n=1 Tax=Dactylosporangium sp. NPDC000521 TaxID=3363975 RepID=UPI0036A6B1F2